MNIEIGKSDLALKANIFLYFNIQTKASYTRT